MGCTHCIQDVPEREDRTHHFRICARLVTRFTQSFVAVESYRESFRIEGVGIKVAMVAPGRVGITVRVTGSFASTNRGVFMVPTGKRVRRQQICTRLGVRRRAAVGCYAQQLSAAVSVSALQSVRSTEGLAACGYT